MWHYVVWLRGTDISEEPKLTFNMEETGSSKKLVLTYQFTWCHMPENFT